jgi:type II secretory pathway pseudopilin PulG
MPVHYRFLRAQQGSALLVSLVILTVITLGAIVAMQRSTLQLRMVGNMQMQQNLFNAAQDDLNNMIGLFTQDPPEARRILNKLIVQEQANSISPNYVFGQVKIDAYGSADGDNNLTIKPAYSNNIVPYVAGDASTSQNKIRALDIPTASSEYSLKNVQGSSIGAYVPYTFASTVTAIDKRGNSSVQELAFIVMAPAQTQN